MWDTRAITPRKKRILYSWATRIQTAFLKHAVQSAFLPAKCRVSHNFIIFFLVHLIFMFHTQGTPKFNRP